MCHAKLEQLIRKIHPESSLLRTWPLHGGASAQMTAMEVALPDGQTKKWILRRYSDWVLKYFPNAPAAEFKILQALQSIHITTQTPYLFDPSGEILSAPYLILEYIEGQPEYAPTDITRFTLQLATQLAEIHRIDSLSTDLSALPSQAKRYATEFASRPAKMDSSIDENHLRETLEPHWPLPRLNEPALLHGDFWPGNILLRNGQIAAVVDWEDAELGDPLADLSFSRLNILWMFGKDAMNDFTRQYQSLTTLQFSNLPYWDLCAALYPRFFIAKWAKAWPSLGREDITEKSMRENHRWFVTQAYERLPAERPPTAALL
jgi:aminoglycoside phosphotransferase (APT) family kinase protein